MTPSRHYPFLAPGFSHQYVPKTLAVFAELQEKITDMDEEARDLHQIRQFVRQRYEANWKFCPSGLEWGCNNSPYNSDKDDNRLDCCSMGYAAITNDGEVASPEGNRRSVCSSLDSKASPDDNGAHSHCSSFVRSSGATNLDT
ncbi:hypothetical protein T265_03917 [Opisthorchis viverrini]|uniref:Uncharacterized protein n=1 Tax=Opisthorchis viverrini TaxID=6198 RepID=A0A074ZQN3_OPIVI|nr:hypothetical protein T265_03917 [Opisthorchis viverrini]KER29451.1 hypothetical protein T265_03917 [Opisthorchis viverrini]